ncbi:MAG: STAS domain-containing protein [Comamonadaceae bacterium]|nr:STAS domain-containing protein [Comamonadaceae bacterium]
MQQAIALPPTLTAETVAQAHLQLQHSLQAQPQGAAIVLDAAGVQAFDSAGLALLLSCRRSAQARGQRLRVQGWTPGLQALAQVYGVLPLLDPTATQQSV